MSRAVAPGLMGGSLVGQLTTLVASLSGMYLDGYSGSTSDGGGATWVPRTGGANFTHAAGAAQPSWSATTGWGFSRASSQILAGPNLSTLFTTTAWTCMIVANATDIDTNNAPNLYYLNDILIIDATNADAGMVLRSTPSLQVAGSNPTSTAAVATGATTGAWHLFQGTYDNANMAARVDAGTAVTQAIVGPLSAIASPAQLGGRVGSGYFNGSMLAVLTFPSTLSAGNLSAVRALVGPIYGVTV